MAKIDFSEEQKTWVREVTTYDPELDFDEDDMCGLINELSDDLQRHGLTDDGENERGQRDAELLTWLARNT